MGTSPELTDLLNGLLKRDAKDRFEFEVFFNHTFLRSERTTTASRQQNKPSEAVSRTKSAPVAKPIRSSGGATPRTVVQHKEVKQQQEQHQQEKPLMEEAAPATAVVVVHSSLRQKSLFNERSTSSS